VRAQPPPPRLAWRVATVVEIRDETPRATSLVLNLPGWPGHRPGQHLDVRLTAEDGYQAQRSYSIASAPEEAAVALTVERIENGEVSPYLLDVLRVGDGLEVRGPIGGYFAWNAAAGGPLFLVAGGSGIVPLMSMLRHHARSGSDVPVRLLYSARSWDYVIFRDELARLALHPQVKTAFSLTRDAPEGWAGYRRRIDRVMLEEAGWPPAARPHVFVCGPTALVEVAATALVELGHDASRVRTERFGPTGDR